MIFVRRTSSPFFATADIPREEGPRSRPLLCRFLDAGMTPFPRAVAAGVQKAPRHEVAGSLALAVQRALWGFDGGTELEG